VPPSLLQAPLPKSTLDPSCREREEEHLRSHSDAVIRRGEGWEREGRKKTSCLQIVIV